MSEDRDDAMRTAMSLLLRLERRPRTAKIQAAMLALAAALPDIFATDRHDSRGVPSSAPSSTGTAHAKGRENRARRVAERRGLYLNKSRRRDPRAPDHGQYVITRGSLLPAGVVVSTAATLDEVERFLDEGPHDPTDETPVGPQGRTGRGQTSGEG